MSAEHAWEAFLTETHTVPWQMGPFVLTYTRRPATWFMCNREGAWEQTTCRYQWCYFQGYVVVYDARTGEECDRFTSIPARPMSEADAHWIAGLSVREGALPDPVSVTIPSIASGETVCVAARSRYERDDTI